MLILDFINFIIGVSVFVISLLIFTPIFRKKKIRLKEDELFLEKCIMTTTFFCWIVLILCRYAFIDDNGEGLFLSQVFAFNIFIILIVLYNLFLAYELYSTFTNPAHYFNSLFKQKKYNYVHEIFILCVAAITLIIDIICYKKDLYDIVDRIEFANDNTGQKIINIYCNDSSVFIIMSKRKPIMIVIISAINIFLYKKTCKTVSKFCFKNQEKLYRLISKRVMSNSLYFIYGFFYTLPVFFNLILTEFYNIFGTLLFLLVLTNDFIIHISEISTTKFCEYKLKNTFLGYLCSFFYNPPIYAGTSTPLVTELSSSENQRATQNSNPTQDNCPDIDIDELRPLNPQDKELIFFLQNSVYMEDYFFGFFNQILNVLTSSIFNVYNSHYFSSQANELRLSSNIQIEDISGIEGTNDNLETGGKNNDDNDTDKTITSSNEIGEDILNFNLKKNSEDDDLDKFKEVLESGVHIHNNNNYLQINLKSYCTQKCIESIYDLKFNAKKIGASLISHMSLSNKKRVVNGQNDYYCSLLAANGKEEYFKSLNNTSFKTFDKNYTLDIFDSDDEEISPNSKGTNKELSNLLDKYFTYVLAKGIKGTFVPPLLGVFKVKINDFKTFLVFVTKNTMIEYEQKNFFTYWQMVRFLGKKPEKMASSGTGTLVTDDPIFERSFQIESNKDNPNSNRISLKNYVDFKETIESDITFLKQCNAQNFDLLLMYYEYENTKKHLNQGTIKIIKTNGVTEIVEESLPSSGTMKEIGSLGIDIGSKASQTLSGCFAMEGGFVDDSVIFNENNSNKKGGNFDINERININGYEGLFDSFNCLCFFSFENIFDIRKRIALHHHYYQHFKKKILDYFVECNSNK